MVRVVETSITAMRGLPSSLFWMFNSGRFGGRRRTYRTVYYRRPVNPMRRLFRVFWRLFWILVGLAIAFSPEFRSLFVEFWVGFAQVAASVGRGLAEIFSQL